MEQQAAPKSERTVDHCDWLAFGITVSSALLVYGGSLAPNVTLEFSGIFSVGAYYAGVPHPPGYPLWTLYAWLFSHLIPFGNIASRIALSSAVAGATASGVVALIVCRAGRLIFREEEIKSRLTAIARIVCGVAAGSLFAFDSAFWRKAVIVDVWPFSVLLFALTLFFLFTWSERPECNRTYLRWAALFFGFTVSNSQALLVAVPGLLAYVLICQPATLLRWKTVVACIVLFLLGWSVVLYSPLASMSNPPVNWAYSRSAEGFAHLILRGQYESIQPVLNVSRYSRQLMLYGTSTVHDFGFVAVILSIVPLFQWRSLAVNRKRSFAGGIAIGFCLSVILIFLLNPGFDKSGRAVASTFFTASHLLLAISAGIGMLWLCRRVKT